MEVFEYLPQLIVAYDGNDEFANLIHVQKANKDLDYFCPCCGGTVKPRALDSTKEQSHYYHVTGKCTKESQLHFFCKNWLFEKGSKFYLGDDLFEVDHIDIEKAWETKFGIYKPDVTVYTTSNKIIYFEMFFSNRKTGDDYFCKWDDLGNDVVEVNVKEYMFKTNKESIPTFTYLYHDGICYSKAYRQRDLYVNTIAKIKRNLTRQKVLNYKARIEQLDWFWEKIRNNESKEDILESISMMEHDDMVSCYEIIKKKQCVSYLKNEVLDMINQNVVSKVRESLDLPSDENVYFDLKNIHGRTFEAGIILKLKTDHVTYDDFYLSCCNEYEFKRANGFPKIVFNKNIHTLDEIFIPEKDIGILKDIFNKTVSFKDKLFDFEDEITKFESENNYKIKINNNKCTIFEKNENDEFSLFLECRIYDYEINSLSEKIADKKREIKSMRLKKMLMESSEYNSFVSKLESYQDIKARAEIFINRSNEVCLKLYINGKQIYTTELNLTMDDFINKAAICESAIEKFIKEYQIVIDLVRKINNCKNKFWKAEFYFNYINDMIIKIDQNYFSPINHSTFEEINYTRLLLIIDTNEKLINEVVKRMIKIMNNMERCGYRVIGENFK